VNYYLSTIGGSGKVRLQLRDGVTTLNTDGNTVVCDGSWHHIIATYEPSTAVKIYIDGSIDKTNTTSIPSSISTNVTGLFIGKRGNDTWQTYGMIDDVRIYSDALSATEVLKNYNAGLSKHRN
jgi:hypothetical protein